MNTPWPTKKLECLVDPIRPITYGVVKPGDNDKNGVIFIRGGDIFQGRIAIDKLRTITAEVSAKYKRTLLRGGELLISLVGNPGEVAITPPSLAGANIARQVGLLALVDSVDPKYVMYFLMSPLGRAGLGAQMKGSVQIVINLADLRNVQIPLPPITIQIRIASILSAYDDLIENNTRRIQILEEMAQRIYTEWFVNFRFPGHEKVKFVDSELGRIPSEWEVKSFGDILDIKYGKTLSKTKVTENSKYPVYGAGGVIGRYHESNVDGPTALVTCRGNGSGTVWRTREKALVTNNCFHIVSKAEYDWSYVFIHHFLKVAPIDSVISGSAQPQITVQGISTVKTLVPPEGLVRSYTVLAGGLLQLVDNLYFGNTNLRLTRDLLLPKLISGEIDVSEMPDPQEVAAA